jgi:hypothetical protein
MCANATSSLATICRSPVFKPIEPWYSSNHRKKLRWIAVDQQSWRTDECTDTYGALSAFVLCVLLFRGQQTRANLFASAALVLMAVALVITALACLFASTLSTGWHHASDRRAQRDKHPDLAVEPPEKFDVFEQD